ncbi:aldo/keto reductase [Celerinatantimonas sp. YJH-8]|uniref:aldo/keto reductase n=1 Tax=Celerinatantimonas sp. YJH-8 TaxID=3228714 RepID=UPI0038CAEF2B
MTELSAKNAGTFDIGPDLTVNRLGFGAMRLTGKGVWGAPEDPASAIRTLQRVPELGINFIDTADAYGPDTSEQMIRQALHPYSGLVIATKGGNARPGPGEWIPVGRPEYLIQQAHKSLRNLGVECIDLWQLHRIDPKVPRDEQFDAIKTMLEQGLIRYAGLSEVTLDDIELANKYFPVATVQNRYNLVDREHESVMDYCTEHNIGFIPWYPLARGELAQNSSLFAKLTAQYNATPGQLALAWILKRSPVMLPIPGTSQISHLEQNVAATLITLSDEDFAALDQEGKASYQQSRQS